MKPLYYLTTWKGIPFRLHYTWVMAALVGIVVLMETTLPAALPDVGVIGRLLLALLIVALCFGAVLIHEAAHIAVARFLHVQIPALNLYPLGALTRLVDHRGNPKHTLAIAVAGPVASIALWGALRFLSGVAGLSVWVAVLLGTVASFSLFVGVVNCLPGLPLDGGRMLRAFFWSVGAAFESASSLATRLGQFMAYGMIVSGAAMLIWWQSWLWGGALLLTGWLMLEAGGTLHRRTIVAQLLDRLTAADVMQPPTHILDPDTTLRSCWPLLQRQSHGAPLAIADETRFYGLVTPDQVLDIPQGYWQERTITAAMTPLAALDTVTPTTPVRMIIPRLTQGKEDSSPTIAVVDGNRLNGLVTAASMNHILELEDAFGLVAHTSSAPAVAQTSKGRIFQQPVTSRSA